MGKLKSGFIWLGEGISCIALSVLLIVMVPIDMALTILLCVYDVLYAAYCYAFRKGEMDTDMLFSGMLFTDYILALLSSVRWAMRTGGKVEFPKPWKRKRSNVGIDKTGEAEPKKKRRIITPEAIAEVVSNADKVIKESVDSGLAKMPYPYLFEIPTHSEMSVGGELMRLYDVLVLLSRGLGGMGEVVEKFDDTVFIKITDPLALRLETSMK